MNAILCDIERTAGTVAPVLPEMFARTGARPLRQARCPHCDSIIYSRRHKLCGVCSGELPETCLFDQVQSENVRSVVREERLRHRAWMQRFAWAN